MHESTNSGLYITGRIVSFQSQRSAPNAPPLNSSQKSSLKKLSHFRD
jgi:hypothetical protein